MLPDRVSNPGPLTYESGALPIALRGPALSRSNLSLDWVGFFVFFRRTRKVIITRTRGYKIEWSSACSSFVRFVLNFMLNIEHENVLKSFITSGLRSDSGIVLS